MNYFHFIGIDLGKESFDATILTKEEDLISHSQFENTPQGVAELIKWVKSFKIKLTSSLFCVENMGSYVSHLSLYCSQNSINLSLACPLMIKKSMGITRGKNDKIDSYRIALFSFYYHRKLMLYTLPDKTVANLRAWIILREQAVKQKVALSKILDGFEFEKKITGTTEQIAYIKKQITKMEVEIAKIEDKMTATIKSNETVNKNYELLTSIVGIGLIVASVLLCSTANFTKFDTHRQFACYCGVAPFEHTSGISVKGRTKISSIGSRQLKAYISRSAISAVRWDVQLKAYYKRKIEQGKHKASVINAVKCKIIARCFAVIDRGTPYVKLQIG